MRFLFGCHSLVASGGLLRLERVGAVLRRIGHSAAYAVRQTAKEFQSALPVLTFEEASLSEWDAVLIPGAGFPDETIAAFARFTGRQFGVRVQMILNDQHLRQRFLKVNDALRPHLVIFNNRHWPPGSYREFQACQFHHVIGAVDTGRFHPGERSRRSGGFVIGAQIAKNPGPLIEALRLLPQDCRLRFFGFDRRDALPGAPAEARIEYAGPLFDDELAEYYRGLDAMVSTEERAGWANVVAEAMASGVPVVTTRAGTLDIAAHEDTALTIEQATPQALAESLLRLKNDPAFAGAMAARARARIVRYDWDSYTDKLIGLVRDFDGAEHYAYAPEIGLFGRATPEERLEGLSPLLNAAHGFRSVLDVGAAEGLVASRFLASGAVCVDCWERDASRVETARRLFAHVPGFSIGAADLTREDDWLRIEERSPAAGYDLVLYLGVHQHLPPASALTALEKLLTLARDRVALRTPQAVFERDGLASFMSTAGFRQESAAAPGAQSFAGPLHIFRRGA